MPKSGRSCRPARHRSARRRRRPRSPCNRSRGARVLGSGGRADPVAAPGRRGSRIHARDRSSGPRASARPARHIASGPQDGASPFADPNGGRLRASDERGHLHSQVGRDLDTARVPPAAAELVGREGARVERRDRRLPSSTLTLHLRHVPWPPHVESIAIPFSWPRRRASRPAELGPCGRPARTAGRTTPAVMGRIAAVDGHGASRAVRACRVATVTGSLGSPKARHEPPDACSDRCAAIQDAPDGSRSSRRSDALIARTRSGVRASMMALVRPAFIAIERNVAPMVVRSGIPNDTFEAPSVMFTPSSSWMSEIVSKVFTTSEVSGPMGMASGSSRMSSTAMPYSLVATSTTFRASSRRRSGCWGSEFHRSARR